MKNKEIPVNKRYKQLKKKWRAERKKGIIF
jgi:hypothetical protein